MCLRFTASLRVTRPLIILTDLDTGHSSFGITEEQENVLGGAMFCQLTDLTIRIDYKQPIKTHLEPDLNTQSCLSIFL